MLKEIKTLYVDPMGNTPSIEDCKEAAKIARDNDCCVRLEWYVKYSGKHYVLILPNDNVDDIYDSLPKVYAV